MTISQNKSGITWGSAVEYTSRFAFETIVLVPWSMVASITPSCRTNFFKDLIIDRIYRKGTWIALATIKAVSSADSRLNCQARDSAWSQHWNKKLEENCLGANIGQGDVRVGQIDFFQTRFDDVVTKAHYERIPMHINSAAGFAELKQTIHTFCPPWNRRRKSP